MRPKLFFQALLGVVSVGAIIMIVIVYFFGDHNTQVVEKVVERQVVVYQQAPAAVAPAESQTVVQPQVVDTPVPVTTSEVPAASPAAYTVDEFVVFVDDMTKSTFTNMDSQTFLSDNVVTVILSNNDQQFILELSDMISGDIEKLSAWQSIKQSLCNASYSTKNIADSLGLSDIHVSIMMENPANQGNMLLVVYDGMTEYDFLWELTNGDT